MIDAAQAKATRPRITWADGPVGDAVRSSETSRLRTFVRDEESEPVALFTPESRAHSDSGDWYGEHLGKWLIAASRAWHRTQGSDLAESIARVVRHVIAYQEPDGYLGTYAPEAPCRFTSQEAATVRTWDLWVHAWSILGLLKASEVQGVDGAFEAAVRAGDLIVATFPTVNASVLNLGNHAGLSSSVLLEPLAELTLATGDKRYADLALQTLTEMERRGLQILSAADREIDVATIGTGKAYQICWTLVGLVATYRATGDPRLLKSAEALWENIANEHLTPMGGPWGGVAAHKEVFNPKGFFSPYGMVETCSAGSWMTLSRTLFEATGNERYAEAFERTLLNTILGAIDANGRDWCYFTFPNGRRNNTYHWACCKSSGAMALEEAADMAVTTTDELKINLLLPFSAEVGSTRLRTEGDPSTTGHWTMTLDSPPDSPIAIRIPAWARLETVTLNGTPVTDAAPQDGYLRLHQAWAEGDRLELRMACPVRVHPKTYTVDHHGQEIVRMDYACLARGPYVYATGLIDGYRKEETLRLARLTPEAPFRVSEPDGTTIELRIPGHAPIPFSPYFQAGGRHEGAWRTTWLQVAWQ